MPGGGNFASFFYPGAGVMHCKLSPGQEFGREKLVARQSVEGGMVTGQTDTCIMMWLQKHNTVYITFRREGINENPNTVNIFEQLT